MNKGDTAVLSAHVRKEKQTDVIWKSNGERGILAGWASKPIDLTLNTSASSALAPNTPVTPIHLLPALANLQGPHFLDQVHGMHLHPSLALSCLPTAPRGPAAL